MIAGLLAGYVDGRLKLKDFDPRTPHHATYFAIRDKGTLKIIQPNRKELEEMMSVLEGRTSFKLFTTNTLAKHLGWTTIDDRQPNGKQPSKRFLTAFSVLTQLFLTGAATPSELEGLN